MNLLWIASTSKADRALPRPDKPSTPQSPPAIQFRRRAVAELTTSVGVYALCDLDGVPIYVGQSVDGIRRRVQRHLTSARSDVIANRQIDVWEIAYVRAWPVADIAAIGPLEAALFHHFNDESRLMNGSVPALPVAPPAIVEPAQVVQMISDEEIERRRQESVRLPRQIEHYLRLVDHYLNVKDSAELRVAMEAHFDRLASYQRRFLEQLGPAPEGSQDKQDE